MENTNKQYALRWTERMTENDGWGDESGVSFVDRTTIIEATSANDANDKWDAEYANDGTNGLHSLHRIIEHPFAQGYVKVEIPNDDTYAVSVDALLREHAMAEVYKHMNSNEDMVADYIEKESIPLFEHDTDALIAWAKAHTDWDGLVEDNAVKRFKTAPKPPVDRATHWKNGTHTFLANIE